MIILNKIDGDEILVNSEEIESVEKHHDTTITLKTGKKLIVRQNFDDIIQKVIEFKKQISDNKITSKEQ